MPMLGAIADDYTGATDLATTLVGAGLRTELYFGVPDPTTSDQIAPADAIVVGLKIRSAPVRDAVAESLAALEFLIHAGCTRFYDKYCATFDSTPAGNIGPVLDALTDRLDADRTIVSQAFPEVGRTVYQGYLFIEGALLEETSMRNHPLTPMTDSKISRLLAPQTVNSITQIDSSTVAAGVKATQRALQKQVGAKRTICVVDAIERSHLDVLAHVTADWRLVSGSAGLAASMRPIDTEVRHLARPTRVECGHRAILAGSASLETQVQVRQVIDELPNRKLEHQRLWRDFDAAVSDIGVWAAAAWQSDPQRPVMIYSVADPSDVSLTAGNGLEDTASLMERAFGAVAADLASRGLSQLIIAGGEVSASVTNALRVKSLTVGPPLSPGVAWTFASCSNKPMNLLLKSGSLGGVDLFRTAWRALDDMSAQS